VLTSYLPVVPGVPVGCGQGRVGRRVADPAIIAPATGCAESTPGRPPLADHLAAEPRRRSRTPLYTVHVADTGYRGVVPPVATTTGPRGRLMTNPRGESFWFDAGAVSLEFGLTGGDGDWAVFETLHTPDNLRAWLASAPLSASVPRATARDLATAVRVRRAITAGYLARAAGDPLPDDVVAALNAAAAREPLAPRLGPGGDAAGWARPATVGQALSTLARDAIGVLSGPLASRIRVCAADDCALPFVDTSRPGTRRWCSMERCGNRHKLRALRARTHG
jgi:predicted RNA-binding Zn ribbon-like protein